MGWTEERIALLRKLWSEGLSATQIAKQLGGVTRNAVIGKVHRLGLAGRATPSRPAKRPIRTRGPSAPRLAQFAPWQQPASVEAQKTSREEFAAALARSQDLRPVTLENGRTMDVLALVESACHFPIGDPTDTDFGFCGRGAFGESPYCADHARLCYAPPKVRKEVDKRILRPARPQFVRRRGHLGGSVWEAA